MKLALILPSEGSINLGNAMIYEATERILRRVGLRDVERFSYLRRPTLDDIKRINECDQAVFVGTNIFQPHALGWAWQPEDWCSVTIPYWFYGVGYSGPLHQDSDEVSPHVRELLEWARGAEGVGVRDPQTVRWLRRFHIESELIGCPVLAHADTFSTIRPGDGPPVLAVREFLLHDPSPEARAAQRAMVEWFFKEYPQGVCVVQETYDLKLLEGQPALTELSEIVEVLSRARFVFTARLHAGMLALSWGKPAIFLAHDTRVASFCELVGLPARTLSFEGLSEGIAAVHALEQGDLSEFDEAVQRIPQYRHKLEVFLRELAASNQAMSSHSQRLFARLKVQVRCLQEEAQALREDLQVKDQTISHLQAQLQAKDHELSELRQTLHEIYDSLGWRLLHSYRRIITMSLPQGTRRHSLYIYILRVIKAMLHNVSKAWQALKARLRTI